MVSKEAKEVYDELIEVYRKHVERGLTIEAGNDAALALLWQLVSWSNDPEETAREMAETLVGMARKWIEDGRPEFRRH
jgi:hypothetical protein